MELDDQIKITAFSQRVSGATNKIPRCIQIQFQCQGKSHGNWLGYGGPRIVDQLGEVMLGYVGPLVDGGILLPAFSDQFQQGLHKTCIFF